MRHALHHLALHSSLLLGLSLSKLLLALDCWPVDAVAHWLAATAKDWEWVQPWICSKDLLPVLLTAHVIDTLKWLSELVQVLNSRLVLTAQHNVELEEGGHQTSDNDIEDKGNHNHDIVGH
jgi:hypothetical protein